MYVPVAMIKDTLGFLLEYTYNMFLHIVAFVYQNKVFNSLDKKVDKCKPFEAIREFNCTQEGRLYAFCKLQLQTFV